MNSSAFGHMARQLAPASEKKCIAELGRLQRLQLLREFVQADENGTPIAPEVLRWIAQSLRDFLEHGGRLDEHLGIAPERYRTRQASHKLLARQERDEAIATIYAAVPGPLMRHKTEATVRIIHGLSATPAGPAVDALEALKRMRGKVAMPESGRQIVRIVHAQAIGRPPD